MNDSGILPIANQAGRDLDPATFRVLVADDDDGLRTILVKAMAADGYEVVATAGGEDLLDEVRDLRPDLVILDIMMPGMDGLTLLGHMRQDPLLASTYVIMMTGKASVEDRVVGLEGGADDYITKPAPLEELRARVKAGIRVRALQRSLEHAYRTMVRHEKLATVGVLASGISHEFNNIMSGICGFAQLAQTNEKFKDRLVEVALQQSERVQKITSSLATYASGMTAGKSMVLPSRLIESAVWLLEKEIQKRDITVDEPVGDEVPALMANFGQIQQVLVNMLLNALQAAGPGGHIAVRCQQHEDHIRIEIDDDGAGVPDDLRHRVFDPFFTTRGAAAAGSEGTGTGLGLTFALNIAHSHGGSIEIVPSQLGGACFQLSLPIQSSSDHDGEPESRVDSVTDAAPRRVLLVEDNSCMQEIVEELLEDAFLATFTEGQTALEACQKERFDVAILDLGLEGELDGLEVAAELEKLPHVPRVVIMTGAIEDLDPDALPSCVLGVLKKPFPLQELEDLLDRASAAPSS